MPAIQESILDDFGRSLGLPCLHAGRDGVAQLSFEDDVVLSIDIRDDNALVYAGIPFQESHVDSALQPLCENWADDGGPWQAVAIGVMSAPAGPLLIAATHVPAGRFDIDALNETSQRLRSIVSGICR